MVHILGGKRKSRYNPDLGNQVNEEFEKAKDLRKIKSKKTMKDEEIIEKLYQLYSGDFIINSRTRHMALQDPANIKVDFEYTPKQILEFSKRIHLGRDFGVFLSILIRNNFDYKKYDVSVDTYNNNKGEGLDRIGFMLRNTEKEKKSLFVHGNVGDFLGLDSKNMKIIVGGYAKNQVGKDAENCDIYVGGMKHFPIETGKGTRIFLSRKDSPGYIQVWPK